MFLAFVAAAAVAYIFLGIVVASNAFKIKLALGPARWPVSSWPALGTGHRNIFAARLELSYSISHSIIACFGFSFGFNSNLIAF